MARDWDRIRDMMREEYGYDDMSDDERAAFDRGLETAIEKKKVDEGEDGGDHHPASRHSRGTEVREEDDPRDDLRRETERDMAWDGDMQQDQEENEQEHERGRSR